MPLSPPKLSPILICIPKMYLLESPLDALAFHYSAALASSAWAWLAVLFAAAISFWRIRAIASPPKPDQRLNVSSTASKFQNSVQLANNGTPVRSHQVNDGEFSGTKGRFMAYFHVEDDGDVVVSDEGDCGNFSDVEERPLWKCEDRRWDLGWYRYLDLTAFDGNVVRLWDRNERLQLRF